MEHDAKNLPIADAVPARRRIRRIGRWLALAALGLFCVPVVLTVVFAFIDPPFSALMVWQRLEGKEVDYRWTKLEDISGTLPATVLMSEDGRFCEHWGVDWSAVAEVLDEMSTGEEPRGASTITMQTVKNLYLWPYRSYVRKFIEVPLAYWVDLVWSKRRIMEVYLNIVQWGPGIYGAEAAAQTHFGIPASRLSWRQSALLAAALPNPEVRAAGQPGPLTRRLAARAEARGRQAGAYMACLETAS
jgi:monofunctional biosynthetic peptidoglycan transglycosylase